DLHGVGDSEGETSYGDLNNDVDDITAVANYLESEGYDIFAIVAHGRGSLAGLKYTTSCEKPLLHYVNIAAAFSTKDGSSEADMKENKDQLERDGYFDWKVYQKNDVVLIKTTKEEVERYNQWDNSHVIRMPKTTCVLTIHGLNDNVIPPYHAAIYANKISNHSLRLLPDSDHCFTGVHDDMVDTILKHFDKHE
ncbi:alpha/beta-hydrolase, partial [Backusella circina FSU 941]